LLFIGIGYLFVGGLDILHLLSAQGMGVFVGSGTNLSTQFWVAGQYVEAFSLLAATAFLDRKVSARLTFVAFSLITGLLLLSIFYWKIFPACFIEGVGLTPFKVFSEYLICLVLLTTIVILIKKSDKFDKTVLILLLASIGATIAQEIAFTKYMSGYGPSNVIGHLLKIVAFYLLYKAIVETSLVSPWNLLFGEFKQSEERLRLFIEHAPASLAMFDRQMRYISSSRRWLSDFNLEERSLEGLSHYEVFPEIGEKWKQIYNRALAGEVVRTEQDRFVRKDGSHQWLRWEVRPWQDSSGEIAGIVVFTEDITERKKSSEQLLQSEARFRSLFELSLDGIFAVDQNGRFLMANHAAQRISGYSATELEEITFTDLCAPESREKLLAAFKRGLQGHSAETEITIIHKDGDRRQIIVAGSPLVSLTKVEGIFCTAKDITEKKQSELALRASEEKLRSILQAAPVGVGLIVDRVILEANERLCSMTGYSKEELTGSSTLMLYPDTEECGWVGSEKYRQISEEGAGTVETVWRKKDGSLIHVLLNSAAIELSNPDAGVIFTALDITDRKTAEQKLKESEERLRLLGDNLPESAVYQYTHQPDGRISFLYFSAGIERLNGVSREDVLCDSSTLYRQIVPGYLERFIEAEKASGREMSDFDMELPMRLSDGQLRWMRLHSRPRRTDEGRTIWDGVQTDVTGRKLMEEELRRSRDEFEFRVRERTKELIKVTEELREKAETIDLVQDAIFVRDHDGRIVFWSRGARETYGFTREEALGKKSHVLLKATFPLAAEKIEQLVLETGEWKGEIKHTKANGQRIVVDSRWALQAGRNGEPPSFIEVNRDITAKKIGEEEFRKVDRALRTLSEFNQAMVRQSDEMEMLRQACKIVAHVGGYRLVWVGFANQDENKTVSPVASAGYDNGYLEQARITWADDERGQGPCGVSIRTGKLSVSQNAESNPVFSPWRFEALKRGFASSISLPLIVDGSVIGALTIYASEPDAFDQAESNLLNDLAQNLSYGISSLRMAQQRRRSESELRVYASRLEAINLELEDFAFIASHDLQEPLRKIQTFCGMAIKRCAPVIDETGRQYLERVSNSAQRMRQLLRDLLEFSRVTNRPAPFKRVDLCDITRAAADIFEQTIEETGCQIELENMPAIEADESQILQLFQNLISNGLKYRSGENPRIRFSCDLDVLGMCEIVVEDNGIGFDQSFAERIFKPFQRLHKRSAYEGTGMGLAICRKIVERHGGSITAESEPGKGSRFIIRLPVKHAGLESVVEEQ
jgi:PAS domain S-box-containing protein